ncbi:tRNA (adenosine(37)-N6)-threonylcarbamoyltransferase complex dimerization subunit type 1 TsaB [soil metagenome]
MTILLAIETSTEMASVALLSQTGLIYRELSGVKTHSQGILPAIQEILTQEKMSLQDCNAIAFGCGPGAFTGVRTACGIVQGLAFGADLPILPVVSLHAMAQAAFEMHADTDFICVLDARMGEVYWAHYRYAKQEWQQISPPALALLEQALAYADHHADVLALGNGINSVTHERYKMVAVMPHAAQVAQLAMIDFSAGKQLLAELAQPLYLRNKIALTTAERMQLKVV